MSSSAAAEPDPKPEDQPARSAWRYWWVVVLSVLVCTVALVAASLLQPKTYTSEANILYRTDSGSAVLGTSASTQNVDMVMATQRQVALSDAVMRPAAEALGLSARQLVSKTTITVVPESNVLTVAVEGETPDQAMTRTKEVAEVYIAHQRTVAQATLREQADSLRPSIRAVRDRLIAAKKNAPTRGGLEATLTSLVQRQAQLNSAAVAENGPAELLTAAQAPSRPSSLSTVTASVIGVITGLVLGFGLLLLILGSRRTKPRD